MGCNFAVTPGSSAETPAVWGGVILLQAAAVGDTFGNSLATSSVKLECGGAGEPALDLEILVWTPAMIVARLPTAPLGCSAPYELTIQVDDTLGLPGFSCTTTQPFHIQEIPLPTETVEPTADQVRALLDTIGQQLELVTDATTLNPGELLHVRLDPLIPANATLVPGAGVLLPFELPRLFPPVNLPTRMLRRLTHQPPPVPSDLRSKRRKALFDVVIGDAIPLAIDVTWEVTGPNADGQPSTYTEGDQFQVIPGPDARLLDPSFLLTPPIVEAKHEIDPAPLPYEVRAKVTLTATFERTTIAAPGNPYTVGPVRVTMLPLQVPTLVALFRHVDFVQPNEENRVFVMVPEHSPLRGSDREVLLRVTETFGRLNEIIGKLGGLAAFAAWAADLPDFLDALPKQQKMLARATNQLNDLGELHWGTETSLGIDFLNPDTHAHDEASSLFFIGARGTRVTCYQHHDMKGRYLDIRVEGNSIIGAAFVRNLKEKPPVSTPPAGAVVDASDDTKDYNDIFNSIAF